MMFEMRSARTHLGTLAMCACPGVLGYGYGQILVMSLVIATGLMVIATVWALFSMLRKLGIPEVGQGRGAYLRFGLLTLSILFLVANFLAGLVAGITTQPVLAAQTCTVMGVATFGALMLLKRIGPEETDGGRTGSKKLCVHLRNRSQATEDKGY